MINYVYILHADDAGPPPSTVINQNETFAKIIFKPSVVQQARIAQNGVLGDFIIRYDVSREQSIGDIQVRGLLLLFYVSCLILLLRLRTRNFNTYLRDRDFLILRKYVLTQNASPGRLVVLPSWRLRVLFPAAVIWRASEIYSFPCAMLDGIRILVLLKF